MQTVMTTTNGGDWILIVDQDDTVIGALEATPDSVKDYLEIGHDGEAWDPITGYIESNEKTISAFGEEIGRGGRISDEERYSYWIDLIGKESIAMIIDSYETDAGQELAALARLSPEQGIHLAQTLLEEIDEDGMLLRGQASQEAIEAAEKTLRETEADQ